jgi:hypothetical protein
MTVTEQQPAYRMTFWFTVGPFTLNGHTDPGGTTRTESRHSSLDDAELAGRHAGCMRGTTRVEVHSPDGTLQALWDKESTETTRVVSFVDEDGTEHADIEHMSSRWQRLGDESLQLWAKDRERDQEGPNQR